MASQTSIRQNVYSGLIIPAVLIFLLVSCERPEFGMIEPITPCERNDMYLYKNSWLWIQMDTAVFRDVTVFHPDHIERIIVFDGDTISRTPIDLFWIQPCETFVKADSEPGIHYEIRSVNGHRLLLAQYCGDEFCRDVNFIRQ